MASKSFTLLEYLVTIETELKKLKKIVAESVGADYSELISQINAIGQELNSFKSSITNTVDSNNTNLITKFNSLEQQFNTFKTSITNTVNSNKSEITSQVNTLTTNFNSFKTSLESQVSSLNSRVTSVERRVTTLENSVGTGGGSVDLTDVNNRISTAEGNITTLQSDVSSLKGRVTSLENNQGSTGGSGEGDGYGEKLIAHYIHQGNQEFHFSSFDFSTCEGTTTEAHGLKEATDVIVVPNDWTLQNRKNGVGSIPMEWVTYDKVLKLVPVDDVTLKLTANDGSTLLPVDIGSDVNQNVDCNNFHFEKTTMWSVSNLPNLTNYFRIRIEGYVKPSTNRYIMWKTKDNKNTEIPQNYAPLYGITVPSVATPKSYNAVFGIHDFIYDFREGIIMVDCKCYCESRRSNLATVKIDMVQESSFSIMELKGDINAGLSYIGNYNANYSFNSNGTHVYIYDLGGTL